MSFEGLPPKPDRSPRSEREGYSPEFQELLKTHDPAKLLEGSHVKGETFEDWERNRRFIAQAIDRDGKILDIGSANGFLLKCLQEWSDHKLDPYGIDADEKLVQDANDIFPSADPHFAKARLEDSNHLAEQGLPESYDLVYWNVWDNVSFDDPLEMLMLRRATERVAPGGRLIMGFYHAEKEHNLGMIKKLKQLGYAVSDPVTAGEGRPEALATIDDFTLLAT